MSNKISFWDSLSDSLKAKAKEVSDKLKEYKEYEAKFADAPPTANEGALKDGTPFKYTGDKLDKGSIVTVISEQGEVPMPPNEEGYVLPDDSIMIVVQEGENSVVSEIKAPEAEAMNNDATLTDVKERVTKIVEKFSEYESAFNEVKSLKDTIAKQNIQIENLKLKVAKQGALVIGLTEFNEAFGAVETDKPAETPVVKKHRVDKLGFIK